MFQYNSKEKQDREFSDGSGLGWHDYGARMYDAQLGRFHTQDRFAEKYYGINQYQYTANNPVNYVDINGDSISVNIIKGGGSKGRDLYQIHVSGKVVDDTSKGMSSKQLNKIAGQVSKQIEKSFKGKDKNIEFETTTDITVADANNPLNSSDHAIRIVDDVATTLGITDAPGTNTEGQGPVGQNVIYLEKGANYARTGAHEIGHSAGLGHIKNEVNPATGAPYTTNDLPGNLMHQSQDRNSNGQPVAGTKIEAEQVKKIKMLYSIPALNRGRQK
ncbi:RHS repeat-associated core domain-containing protein [Pontibacter pudoricolor]|uniref:RHS repeat-associated core domain-containing protein n=1 Tax=Pontibacter pudoricolor TaxID=2694930 RepID=UPI001EE4046A|nr:RHS repeat-associated core domain-containing protein [Pontibacter pudoricolor]